MNKSDAESTVEHCILSGLVKRAHLTRVTAEVGPIIIEDVKKALVDPGMIWAIKEYIQEVERART